MNDKLSIIDLEISTDFTIIFSKLNLVCETGNIIGIVGKNGSGKTVLLKSLFGINYKYSGLILLNNINVVDLQEKSKSIVYLPSYDFIPSQLTLKNVFDDYNLDFTDFVNEFPDFKSFYRKRVGKLSEGEKRILGFYTVLYSHSKFCLLDDPFSQISPIYIEKFKILILKQKQKKGIIIADMKYERISDIATFVYLLKFGKLWAYE